MSEKKKNGHEMLAEFLGGDGTSEGQERKKGAVKKFAKRIGVSRTTIYNWLEGSSVPSRAHAKTIAAATKDAVPAIVWG